jgi:hypothetical protein
MSQAAPARQPFPAPSAGPTCGACTAVFLNRDQLPNEKEQRHGPP